MVQTPRLSRTASRRHFRDMPAPGRVTIIDLHDSDSPGQAIVGLTIMTRRS
ncbi:MAG: hypothetical protein ACRDJE_27815 [Dehalococcoidia bacterium]